MQVRLICAVACSLLLHAALLSWPEMAGLRGRRAEAPAETPLALTLREASSADAVAARPSEIQAPEKKSTGIVQPGGMTAPPRGRDAGGGAYYSSERLSRPPEALSEVKIDRSFPAQPLSASMVLLLWIDEAGSVVRVDIEKTDYPAGMSEAVVRAFGNVLFRPGEIDSKPVAALLRIEATLAALSQSPY